MIEQPNIICGAIADADGVPLNQRWGSLAGLSVLNIVDSLSPNDLKVSKPTLQVQGRGLLRC
jgi:hypothetical protein